MKRILAVATALIFVSQLALAADVSVSRIMPDRVDPLGTLTVSFSISPTETLTGFDFSDLIPQDWEIKNWSVSGFDENDIIMDVKESQEFMGETYKGYHWKFNTSVSSDVTLTYNLDVPVSSGSYDFLAIWVYPGGFDKSEQTLTVEEAATTTTTVPATTTTTTTTIPSEIIPSQYYPMIIGVLLIVAIVLFFIWKGIIKI